MSDLEAPLNRMTGHSTERPCAICQHPHERTEVITYTDPKKSLTWTAGCECGCTANGGAYDFGELRPWITHADILQATPKKCKKHGWPVL